MRQRIHLGNRNVIGAHIRRIREKQEMEQADVIAKVELMGEKLTQSKLSRIEGQQSSVTDHDLMVLAELPVSTVFLYLTGSAGDFFALKLTTK